MDQDNFDFNPQPVKTSTPTSSKLPQPVLDSEFSDCDDFVSPMPYPQFCAGSTPFSRSKPPAYPFSFTPPRPQPPSQPKSGLILRELESILEKQRKESCLFGTIHVKGLAAFIVLIDFYFITECDKEFFKNPYVDFSYNASLAITLPLLLVNILALIGLQQNRAWMMLPFTFVHGLFIVGYNLIYAPRLYNQMLFVHDHLEQLPRFIMVVINRCLLATFATYTVIIMVRCYLIIKKGGPTIPTLNVVNDCITRKSETLSPFDRDDDIVIFDSIKSKSSKFVASPGPMSVRRHVRFLENV